ncbi:MAG: hypothetical protein IPN90_01255 [Elusimicrobia bacterium]|nr:hypothetical protein [Elusimicrobiota bacterium]
MSWVESIFNYSHWSFWTCLLAVFVLGVIARFMKPIGYCEWIDRDIQRTIGLISGHFIPLVGPEMNTGGFLPGPFLYFLMSPALLFSKSPYSVAYYNQLMNLASIVLIFFIVKKVYSPFVTMITVALMSFSLLHVAAFSVPINPSYILILNSLMFLFIVNIFINDKEWYFVPAVILTALGTQIHMSFSAHVISITFLAIFVRKIRWPVVLTSICGAFLTFLPFVFYKYTTRGITVNRSIDQFTGSNSIAQFLPKDVFCKIFPKLSSESAWEFVRQAVGNVCPGLASGISHSSVSVYSWLTLGIELIFLIFALGLGFWLFSVWGYKTKFHFSAAQRKVLVPFVAVFPVVVLWQWTGFARHPHMWYGLIFFPLVPVWIGSSLEIATRWPGFAHGLFFRKVVLGALFFLSLKPLIYCQEFFFRLDDVVADIRDVKTQLGLPIERYRNDVYYLDRPFIGKSTQMDPPFEYPPWGTYTDFLYDSVTSDISGQEAPKEKRYLIGHKQMVDQYTLKYYLDQIRDQYAVAPVRVFESSRFVYFEYDPLPDGNCFHNTINAWVQNERMNSSLAKIKKGDESVLLEEKQAGTPFMNSMKFAVYDRKSSLPLNVLVDLKKWETGSAVKVSLESGQLMGHLNTTIAYSGLFRPWPKLWIRNIRLAIEKEGQTIYVKIIEGEVGRILLTPLDSPFIPVGIDMADGQFKLTLVYNTTVAGSYRGRGKDIQSLVNDMDTKQEWETAILLYNGNRGIPPMARRIPTIPPGGKSNRPMGETKL